MRSGMGKRILNKVTAITFILILFMQMVIPLFVEAVETETSPTRISVTRSGKTVNFKIDYINTHGIKSTVTREWQEKTENGNWTKVGSDSNNYSVNIEGKLGNKYRCITNVTVRLDQSLVSDAYEILLNREADDGGYAHWENMLRNHTSINFARENYIRDFLGTTNYANYCCNESTALTMQLLISEEALDGTNNRWKLGLEEVIKRLYRFLLGREASQDEINNMTTTYTNLSSNTRTVRTASGAAITYNQGMLEIIRILGENGLCHDYMSNKYGGFNRIVVNANGEIHGRYADTILTVYTTYQSTSNEITMPKYPVTLTVEGGTGIASVTGGGSYNAGDTVSISTTLKEGYNWVNWSKKGTIIEVSQNQTFDYTIPYEENITLCANANPNSYTVAYDGNEATGGKTNSTNHMYDTAKKLATNGYTRSYTVTYEGNGGTKPSDQTSNYAFYRWTQYANGTGNAYTSGQSVKNLSTTNGATITLYAQWKPVAVTLPNTSRNAYTFGGWYNETSRIGGIGDSYTPTANTTLTAHWDLIKTNVAGSVTWNDQNNKYNARPKNAEGIETVNVTLTSDEAITETTSSTHVTAGALATPNTKTVVGTNYNFENLQEKKTKDNSDYVYTVTQGKIPGYETTVGNKANGYTITNTLVLPTYTSEVTYTPVNSFQNKYLQNGTVQVVGTVIADSDNRGKSGLNNGEVTFTIDEGIAINADTLKIKFFKKQNSTTYDVRSYVRNGNTITAKFGENASGISEKGDKITIEVQGKLTKMGEYTSNIVATGKLRDYANGDSAQGSLGTVTSSNNAIQVDEQLPKANVQIETRDSITKEKLTDATFTLYEWNKENSTYTAKETIRDTNQDGIYESKYYEWNIVSDGKYKIVQTGMPANHEDLNWSMEFRINNSQEGDYTIRPDYSNSNYTINYGVRNPDNFSQTDGIVENEPWKLKTEIEKVDSETKNVIQNPAVFSIYEWNKETRNYEIYVSKTTTNQVKMDRQVDKTYLAGEWLYYTAKNEGKYRIIETETPEVYYVNYDENGEVVTYDINLVESIKRGNYQGQVVQNGTTVRICNTDELTLTNHRQQARLDIKVVDSQTKGKAQADSTLEGAKYGIYAFEAIHHPEDGRVLYEQGQLVQERTTNAQGKLAFTDLECGKYYVQMREPAEGYLIDETEYRVDFEYQPEIQGIIEKTAQLEMKVKKQAFQLYKLKENNTMLSNAGFSIYLVSNLSIVKTGKITRVTAERYYLNDVEAQKDDRIKMKQNADGTYYLKDLVDYYYKITYAEGGEQTIVGDGQVYHPYNLTRESLVKNYANTPEGETIEEIRTNSNGYMRTPELAYGEYIVIETSVPKNYDVAAPFMVNIYEDSRDLQDIRFVTDNDFTSKIKIYTRDTQTRKPILNTTIQYVIKNIETDEYMTQKMWVPQVGYVEYGKPDTPYETLDTGFIITPIQLPIGQYELIEITAGEGYTTNAFEGSSVNGQIHPEAKANVQFEIKTDSAYYTDTYLGSYIIVVNNFNKAVVGNISIRAQGEYISGISSNEKGDYCFAYEVRNVPNTTYEIHAKEDIYTPDNQGTKLYNKDEVVGYITTNENGEGMIENLPLGDYYIREAESEESFALKEEIKEVTLSYEGQEVPVVFRHVEESEIRQKIEIIVHNKDAETGELRQGGKYGLYTKEEITFTNVNGTRQTIPTNTLLATVINENGEIRFCAGENIDLPQGKYYVKELEAPIGYVLQEEVVEIDTRTNNNKETILRIEKEILGAKTIVSVQEKNLNDELIRGSQLEIIEKATNEVIQNWQTEGDKKTFRNLKTNTEYLLREVSPAAGYVTAEEITFIIKTNGKIEINREEQENNTITILARATKLDVRVVDELNGSNVEGIGLQIINKETGNEMVKWMMQGEPQRIEGLPIGNYTIKEISLPKDSGYVTITDVDFSIQDTAQLQEVVLIQRVSKCEVFIRDELELAKYAEGTKWQIIHKKSEEVADEWVQGNNKHTVNRLSIGSYLLKEVEVPQSSGYVTNATIEFEIEDTLEMQIVETVQMVSKCEIFIKDELEPENFAEGTKWQILEKETEEVVDEWIQGENKHEVKKLPIGNYVLKEVQVPQNSGYVTNANVNFEILDTLEIQRVDVVQNISKLDIFIREEETERYAEGTKWQILEKETGAVVYEWTQGNNKQEVKKLPVGNYVLKEIELPEGSGYITNAEMDFQIRDTLEIQKLEIVQNISKLEIEVKDELEPETYAEGTKWQILEKETGILVNEWTQGNKKHEVKRLPIGNYVLKEIKVPEGSGYVTNADTEFTVSDTLTVQKLEIMQKVSKLEIEIKDEVEPEKYAEGTKWQILKKETGETVDEWTQGKEKHEVKKLPIGNYVLKQVEIPTGSGYVTNTDTNFSVLDTIEVQKLEIVQKVSKVEVFIKDELNKEAYAEGTKWQVLEKKTSKLVYEWTQGKEKHEIKKLPMGNYILREIEIPIGSGYVTNEDIDFEIQDTLEVQKVETVQMVSKVEILVKDELNPETYAEGTKWQILDKTTKKVVDEWTQGKEKHEVKKLPIGNYLLKEIEVPEGSGYVTNADRNFSIIDTLEVQKVETVQLVSKVEILVKDELNPETYAEGTKWKILDKTTKKVVDEWTQGKEEHEVKKLPIGNYVLKEVSLPKGSGYVTIKDVEFRVQNTREIQAIEVKQKVSRLQVFINDELEYKTYAEETKWQIVDKETGKIVDKWTQGEGKHEVNKLPIGDYVLKEVEVPKDSGYVTNADLDFSIKDTLEVQIVETVQSISRIEILVKDELEPEKYAEGTKWQILKKETGEVVDKWVQGKDKYEAKKLPIGNYVLKEMEVPKDSGYVTNADMEFTIKDTLEIQKIDVMQNVSKVEVCIKDELEPEAYAEGTKWQIIEKETEEVVDEWTQGEEKHEIKKLPMGNYVLKEIEVPTEKGYVTNVNTDFEVLDTLDVQNITVNQEVSKVSIKIVDKETEENMIDKVEINIVDKETEEIIASTKVEEGSNIRKLEKTEDSYDIERLLIGNYTIIETKIPEEEGYVEYQKIELEVKDTVNVQITEIQQDVSKLLIKVIDEETKDIIPGAKLQIVDKQTKEVIAQVKENSQKEIEDSEEKDKLPNETIKNEKIDNLKQSKLEKEEKEEQKEEAEQKETKEIIETKEGYKTERLPIGSYILRQEIIDGYHEVEEKEFTIENTSDEQEEEMINTRLICNTQVEKSLEKIILDGVETKVTSAEARKIEIKERKIKQTDLKLQYVIRVSNLGETDIKIGTIVDNLPNGFELVAQESEGWTMKGKKAIYQAYEEEILKPGETREVRIVTKWKNEITNFGDKTNTAELANSSNPYGYEDKNDSNDIGESIVYVSVGTGVEIAIITIRIMIIVTIGSVLILCFAVGIRKYTKKNKH